jgi:signal transduction histidine kinase
MGIGLSVTAEVLKAHGGTFHMENALAGGAIVTFEFPQP